MGAVLFGRIPAGPGSKKGARLWLKTETYDTEGFCDTIKHLGRYFMSSESKIGIKHGEEVPKGHKAIFEEFHKSLGARAEELEQPPEHEKRTIRGMVSLLKQIQEPTFSAAECARARRILATWRVDFPSGDLADRVGDEILIDN